MSNWWRNNWYNTGGGSTVIEAHDIILRDNSFDVILIEEEVVTKLNPQYQIEASNNKNIVINDGSYDIEEN